MKTPPQQDADFSTETPYFYAVGAPKFVIMWLGTLGVYGLFWFYQHWKVIRDRQDADFKPWHRMLLAGSFCEPLILAFQSAGKTIPNPQPLRPRLQAVLWLATTATLLLGPPWSLVCPFAFLPLISAQRAANQVNAALTPLAKTNAGFGVRDLLALLPLALALAWLVASSLGCHRPDGHPM